MDLSIAALCAAGAVTLVAAAEPETNDPTQTTSPTLATTPTPTRPAAPSDFETYTPLASAVRISSDEAPKIDGDLSDAVWSKAIPIDEFYQVEPTEGARPSQETRAYILYDDKTLYVAVYNYDDEPDKIRRSQLQRDPAVRDDDAIRIFIDSYGTYRDSYFFAMNANGARADALTENETRFRLEWNTIWRGKAKVVDDGWVTEFAIPFQSISFDPNLDAWNFQIIRTIRRSNEEIRWSNIDRNRRRIDLTNPGKLEGITDVDSGLGLEAQLFLTGAGAYDWELDDTDFSVDPSANIFYKITPSLTGSLTFNTDFSDAPLDQRQVNTGRFSLFFPETRDFFLQDAAVFEFGGRVFRNNTNGLPFFSRNIGIVDGAPVDIVAGAKLSGKVGIANIGAISTRTGSADSISVDGQYLSSARVSVPILSESKVGIVFTSGDPSGGTDNTVAGADFQYKRSNLFGSGVLTADFAFVHSSNDEGDDAFFGVDAFYRSETWNAAISAREIGENYAPELGFVNRRGIRKYNPELFRAFRPADSFVRRAETGVWTDLITDLNDERLDHFYGAWGGGENHAGDEAWLRYKHGYVDIREPFSIADEVDVPVGEYRWDQYSVELIATRARRIGGSVRYLWGGLYGGDTREIETRVTIRPNKHFELDAEYEFIDIDLPSGQIGIHIASLETTLAFTPDMFINTEVQYDNISEGLTFFSRFSWEPRPHQEVFLSLGHSAIIERDTFPREFVSQGSSLSLRLGHTIRM